MTVFTVVPKLYLWHLRCAFLTQGHRGPQGYVFDRLRPTVKYDSFTYSHLFALCTLGASCFESWNDCSLPLSGGGLMLAGGCLDSCLEVGGNLAPSTPTGRLTKSWLEKSIRSGGWCLKTRYLYTVACMTERVLGPCAQGAC